MQQTSDTIESDKYILIVDNRNDRRLFRIADQKGFRWRKIPIDLKQLCKFSYHQGIQVINGTLKPIQLEDYQIEQEDQQNNNREIYTLEDTQKLQTEQIQQMKKQLHPNQLIQSIVDNNQQFSKRTVYSKEKYLLKKQHKYLFTFHAEPTTPQNVHNHYYLNEPSNVAGIRWDILAFMMLEALPLNHVFIAEKTKGILAGTVLVKGAKSVTSIVQVNNKNCVIPQQLNLEKEVMNNLNFCKWNQISELKPIYTNLLMAGNYDFKSIILKVNPLLKLGSTILLYCMYIEPLTECHETLLGLGYIKIRVYDGWTRQYQVLKNRTHPLMNMNSHPGYLLSAIKVQTS